MIDKLKAMKDADTALIYMSDHGESLGERVFSSTALLRDRSE